MTVGFNFLSTFCPPVCFAPRTDSLFRNTSDGTSVCLTTCGKESGEYLKPFLIRPSSGLSGFSLLRSNVNHSSHTVFGNELPWVPLYKLTSRFEHRPFPVQH